MQKKIFERVPVANTELPERIGRLNELAYNMWWAWNPDAINLFKMLHPTLWDHIQHNPIVMLEETPLTLLKKAAENEKYLKEYDRILADFDAWLPRFKAVISDEYLTYLKGA